MAGQNNIPLQYIIDQIKDLKSEIGDRFDRVDDRFTMVENRLTGNDGILERLTTLEVKVEQAVSIPPASPVPSGLVKRKKGIKDHAPALGAGAGATGLIYMLVELANTLLKTK